jgi:hypothetical protein
VTAATLIRPSTRGPRGPYRRRPIRDRIHSRSVIDDNGCWRWMGALDTHGYGQLRVDYVLVGAHRASYEAFVGPIPAGLVIDHLCRVRDCVNPGHMEPVTNLVNILRGEGFSARNARKTHCKRNHPLSADNVYPNHPGRACITCARARA